MKVYAYLHETILVLSYLLEVNNKIIDHRLPHLPNSRLSIFSCLTERLNLTG